MAEEEKDQMVRQAVDEVAAEIDARVDQPLPPDDADRQGVISVDLLMAKARAAGERCGRGNPHRLLFLNLAYALQQMKDRLEFYEAKHGRP